LSELYLRDRYQRVQITNSNLNQNTFSKWAKLKHGTVQGSILGPVSFLLCINDLPKVIESKGTPILFADDTSILITGLNSTKLQNDTNIVFKQTNNASGLTCSLNRSSRQNGTARKTLARTLLCCKICLST